MIRTRIREKKKTVLVTRFQRRSFLVKTTRKCRCVISRRPKTSPRFARLSRSSRNRQILELYIYAIFFSLRDSFRIFSCDPSEPIVKEPVNDEIDHEEKRRGKWEMWRKDRNNRVDEMIDPRNRDKRFARFHPGDQRNTVDIIHVH